jgi:hypothetical protein
MTELSSSAPEGLILKTEFLTVDEEQVLLGELRQLEMERVYFHGVFARRTVAHFGHRYGYSGRGLTPTASVPDWLEPIRQRAASWIATEAGDLAEVLIPAIRSAPASAGTATLPYSPRSSGFHLQGRASCGFGRW